MFRSILKWNNNVHTFSQLSLNFTSANFENNIWVNKIQIFQGIEAWVEKTYLSPMESILQSES